MAAAPAGAVAAEALVPDADEASLEAALSSLLNVPTHEGIDPFRRAFGPRRLMRLLLSGALSDAIASLADVVLSLSFDDGQPGRYSSASSCGLARSSDLSEAFKDELYPDETVQLSRPMPGQPQVPEGAEAEAVLRAIAASCEEAQPTQACKSPEDPHADGTAVLTDSEGLPLAGEPATTELLLHSLSRREILGAEIECKVWPSALIIARLLWSYPWLVAGLEVLELGAGVGLCGLAAARAGASLALLTDINEKALKCARENVSKNGDDVLAAARVAYLDWADPPVLDVPHGSASTSEGRSPRASAADVDVALSRQHDVLLVADVVNADGLPALVHRMVRLYLRASGVFLMCAPKPEHRHKVDELRGMLLESEDLDVHISPVPRWLSEGSEEAQVVAHELYVVRKRANSEAAAEQAGRRS